MAEQEPHDPIADELAAEIEAALMPDNLAELWELEREARREQFRLLEGQMTRLEEDYGTADEHRTSYHVLPLAEGRIRVLMYRMHRHGIGPVRQIIVNQETFGDDRELNITEYALPMAQNIITMRRDKTGGAGTMMWNLNGLTTGPLLLPYEDRLNILYILNQGPIVPPIAWDPHGAEFIEARMAAHELTNTLMNLSAGTHEPDFKVKPK